MARSEMGWTKGVGGERISMKSFVIAVSLSLLLVTLAFSASAPPFPFQRYDQVPIAAPPQRVCENGGMLVEAVINEWRILSWPSRDLFIHFGPDGNADWAYLTVDKDDGVIRVKRVLPAAEARVLYPTGCEYGDERDA